MAWGSLKDTRSGCAFFLFCFSLYATNASADVVISANPTANMACSEGFCEPTAANAVLNAHDLEKDIKQSGNMTVQTTGNGVEANNIVVEAAFASAGGTFLNLFATKAIRVEAPVTIGSGGQLSGLELLSETGGTFGTVSCGRDGKITFDSTSDQFNINGVVAVLVGSVRALARAVRSNPQGFYVLAKDYDAGNDGTYRSSPIGTTFTGTFEALGNAIDFLRIRDTEGGYVGLFAEVDSGAGFGIVRNLRLGDVSINAGANQAVGAIVGYLSGGALSQSSATGRVQAGDSSETGGLVGASTGAIQSSSSAVRVKGGSEYASIGGLAGTVSGTVANSSASGTVTGGTADFIGGLLGESGASVSTSFATGAVRIADTSYAGGLVGVNYGALANSYATGSVNDAGGDNSALGGLIGFATAGASDSYALGAVTGEGTDNVGGVVGYDDSNGGFAEAYWDITTSDDPEGAGNIASDSGLAGLTSRQLRAGLPDGFDPSIWKQKPRVNRGFPWLRANRPAQ